MLPNLLSGLLRRSFSTRQPSFVFIGNDVLPPRSRLSFFLFANIHTPPVFCKRSKIHCFSCGWNRESSYLYFLLIKSASARRYSPLRHRRSALLPVLVSGEESVNLEACHRDSSRRFEPWQPLTRTHSNSPCPDGSGVPPVRSMTYEESQSCWLSRLDRADQLCVYLL